MTKLTEIDWHNHLLDFTYDYATTGITVSQWVRSHLPDINHSYARRKIRRVDAQGIIAQSTFLITQQCQVKHKKRLARMKKKYFRRLERHALTGKW